jgi:transcription termination/antitermination protein NusG
VKLAMDPEEIDPITPEPEEEPEIIPTEEPEIVPTADAAGTFTADLVAATAGVEGGNAEGAAAEEEPDDFSTDGRHWYVIHTYSGYENKVKKNLEHRIVTLDMGDRIFRVEVPTVEEIEIRSGQRHPVQRKIFPGYVLVEMVMDDESWYVVRNTPGVTGFVGMGNKPTALPEEEASSILKQMTTAAPTKFKVTLQPGQAVKITDGPFADFEGIVDNINQEKGKVRVRVSMFGRETPIELDFLQVERLV